MSLSAPLPMARVLATLRDAGHVAASSVPAGAQGDLAPLVAGRILVYQSQGAGRRLVVNIHEELDRYITQHYPLGIDALLAADLATADRSTRQGLTGNSKSGGSRVNLKPVSLRGMTANAILVNGRGETLDLSAGTRIGGCVSATLGRGWEWGCVNPLTIATTENQEVFYRVEQKIPHLDLALFASGRLSDLVVQWLGQLGNCRVVHCGDYDPVGLGEYMRLRRALGDRVQLYMPENLEELFSRYSNHRLLEKKRQQELLRTLRQQESPPEVARVLRLIMKHNAGLEQERIWATSGA